MKKLVKNKSRLSSFIVSACFVTLAGQSVIAHAAPEPKNEKVRTPQGLYVDSKEAHEMMKKDPKVILVDVRTPEEWQFVGNTAQAHIMIPSVKFVYDEMNPKKPSFKSINNDKFVSELEEAAVKYNADEKSTYILMCRSGTSRAQPAAKMLDQYGYKNVYIMTDGFEGSTTKEGDKKGFRLVNGWKNSGFQWSYDIDPAKVILKK